MLKASARLFAFLSIAALPGCLATTYDLQEMASKFEIASRDATSPQDARRIAAQVLTEKSKEIEQRAAALAEATVPGTGEIAGLAGAITTIGLAALNLHRNKTRAAALKES